MDFGEAIKALKQGKRVAREGWGSKNSFVFRQIPAVIQIDTVSKMQSLPQPVKNEFFNRFQSVRDTKFTTIHYVNQLARVYPNNEITGWSPSAADVLEEDWIILD